MKTNKQGGFSLLEIMIVVAIIAILAAIATPNLIEQSKRTLAKQQLQVIVANLEALRIREDGPNGMVPLGIISTSFCSMCEGGISGAGGDPKVLLSSTRYQQIWQNLGYDKIPIDPWGNPIRLDENDEEFPLPYCNLDTIWSAGPDRIFQTTDGDDVNGDDIVARLKPIRRKCKEDPQYGGYL